MQLVTKNNAQNNNAQNLTKFSRHSILNDECLEMKLTLENFFSENSVSKFKIKMYFGVSKSI